MHRPGPVQLYLAKTPRSLYRTKDPPRLAIRGEEASEGRDPKPLRPRIRKTEKLHTYPQDQRALDGRAQRILWISAQLFGMRLRTEELMQGRGTGTRRDSRTDEAMHRPAPVQLYLPRLRGVSSGQARPKTLASQSPDVGRWHCRVPRI